MADDYDPHEHREVKVPITNLEAFVNMLKGNLGSGVVALPIAFKYAGWIPGLAGIPLVGVLTVHTLNSLIAAEYRICKRKRVPLLQYGYAMEAGTEMGSECTKKCGKTARITAIVFIILLQIGACVSYVIFGAGVLRAFVNSFTEKEALSQTVSILITLAPYFFSLFVLDLKTIAPLSLIANILMIVGFCLSFRYLFVELEPLSERSVLVFETMPMFFGTAIFSMQAVGLISHVEYSMKSPKDFGGLYGMFPLSIYVLVVLYVIIAFFGYWRYGEEVKGNFLLNFPPRDIIPRIINVFFFFSMFVSYGLNAVVPCEMIWDELLEERVEKHVGLCTFALRFTVYVLTFALALGLPNLGVVVSLTGAVCMSFLGIIFPMVLDIQERYEIGYGKLKWILIKDTIIIIIGLLGFGAGIYSCFIEAMEHRTDD